MHIEQAVFTSARTQRARGYQLAAVSPGVRPEDAQQLAAWGPSHGSLRGGAEDASSVNFHPLPSGAWCVSKTENAGPEYSGRGGLRIYTQCLIVPPAVLARFANHPFALLRAARAHGLLEVRDPLPATLAPFELPGQAEPADEGLLAELADRLGPRRLAWLVQGAVAAESLVVVGEENAEWLAAGLLNCLPVECRPELSCTTGLVFSQRRPFRLHVMSAEPAEKRQLQRQPGVTLVDLAAEPPADFAPAGWGAYLAEAARLDRLACVAAELRFARPGMRLADLANLADELTLALYGSAARLPAQHEPPAEGSGGDQRSGAEFADSFHRSHSAHRRFGEKLPSDRSVEPAAASRSAVIAVPSELLTTTSHVLLEKLERLDDLVFDTINGRRPALEELTQLWPRMMAELPPELLHESREQYLRYAVKLWDLCATDRARDPQWAVSALDVLCVLFDEKS